MASKFHLVLLYIQNMFLNNFVFLQKFSNLDAETPNRNLVSQNLEQEQMECFEGRQKFLSGRGKYKINNDLPLISSAQNQIYLEHL